MKYTKIFYCALFIIFLSAGIGCNEKKPVIITDAEKDTTATTATVSVNPYEILDQSPLDIIYYPDEFPQKKMKGELIGAPVARIIYSRPHKKGRIIFSTAKNSLCPFGEAWRLGANEATEIEFYRPVFVNGKNIAAGRYVLYCIPYADKWEIIFNTNLNSWGLDIDPAKDVYKTELPTQLQNPAIEDFTMIFQETATGSDLLMAWDNVKVSLPITFSK